MRRKVFVILGAIIVILVGVGIAGATSNAAPSANASVKAVVTAARSGQDITYSITLVNDSNSAAGNVYLASTLPAGVKFNVAASTAKGSTAGAIDGNVVAWLVKEVPAKGKVGPFTYKVTASTGDVSPVNAWVRWVTPAEGSTMSNLASAEYQLAKMRAIANWDGEVYPDKKVAITLAAGYGKNYNNNIVTSGLPNVGIGEYAYLEGKDKDATATDVSSWAWELVKKPFGSKATLEGANTRTPRFIADSIGEYVARVTVTNAKGATSSSHLTINAGKYAGSSLCASCHDGSVAQDIVSKWSQTGHATKFETTYDRYSATSDYCARCHTLGYNETANNGGMDETARAAGWNPANGSFLAWLKTGGKTIDDVKADTGMASTINIQCENCHGPGGSSHTQSKSFEIGVCNQCHDISHGAAGTQWAYSGHNRNNDYQKANPACVKCHTSQGFVEVQIRGNEAIFPNAATPDKPANLLPAEEQSRITCVTCHDPHAATYPFKGNYGDASYQLRVQGEVTTVGGWTVDAEVSAVCVKCHSNNRTQQHRAEFIAGKQSRSTHGNTQADIFFGQGAFDYGEKLTNSAHTTVVTEGCVTCHMASNPIDNAGPDGVLGNRDDVKVQSVGGHSFNVKNEWEYADKHKAEVENTGACKSCHGTIESFNIKAKGDYDGDGTIEGTQDEVKGLLDILATKLPKDANGNVLSYPVNATNSTEGQRKAMWNYFLVNNDGSKGVHNVSFTVQLLQKSYKQLTGKDVPGATLR